MIDSFCSLKTRQFQIEQMIFNFLSGRALVKSFGNFNKLLILSCGRCWVFHTIFIISQAHYRKIASHYSFPVDGTREWFQRKQTVGKWQLFSNKWLIATPHISHNNLHISTGMSPKYFSLTGDTKTCQINCFVGSFIIAVSPTAFVPIIKYCFPFRL